MRLHRKWVGAALIVLFVTILLIVLVRGNAQGMLPDPSSSDRPTANPWPRLSWAPVEDAVEYGVEIKDSSNDISSYEVWGESLLLPDPLPVGVSSWRVRARIGAEWGAWSRWTKIEQLTELPTEPYTILVDGTGDLKLPDMCRTDDGGHLLVFCDTEGPIGGEDIAAVRLDPQGKVVWQYVYGGADDDRPGRPGHTVEPLNDGSGYLVAGLTRSFSRTGEYNPWLLVLDGDGKITWQNWFGAPHIGCARFVATETLDGDIVAAAVYQSTEDVLSRDAWVVRLDRRTGEIVWQNTYGGQEHERADRILVSRYGRLRGDIILAGHSFSQDIGFNDPNVSNGWFLRLAADTGEIRHQRHYGWDTGWYEYDGILDAAETYDGALVLTGFSGSSRDSMGFHSRDVWIARADARGVVDEDRRALFAGYGDDWHDVPLCVVPLPSGEFVIAGGSDRHYDLEARAYYGSQPTVWRLSQGLTPRSVDLYTWPPESSGHITSCFVATELTVSCGTVSSANTEGSAVYLMYEPRGVDTPTDSPIVKESRKITGKPRPFQQGDTTAIAGSAVDMVGGTTSAQRRVKEYTVRRW